MGPDPEKHAQAYHEWFYKSIVDIEKERLELGKFLLVTSGSVGTLVAVSQFAQKNKWGLINPLRLSCFWLPLSLPFTSPCQLQISRRTQIYRVCTHG